MSSSGKFNINDSLGLFFIESREMLVEMENCLLAIEKNSSDEESINALFRTVHTIKGSAGMFGLDEIEKFTHVVENVLDRLRIGEIEPDEELIGVVLKSHDFISRLIDISEKALPFDDGMKKDRDDILLLLRGYSILDETETVSVPDEKPEPTFTVQSSNWHISLRFGKDIFRNGIDPQSAIKYLSETGRIINILPVYDSIPSIFEIEPESCYIGFDIQFEASVTKEKIESVFEFIKDDCEIWILPPKSAISDYVNLITHLPETPMKIGEMLIRVGSLTEFELEKALRLQKETQDGAGEKFLGEIMLEKRMVDQPVLDAVLEKQKEIKKTEDKKSRSIRIDADKLDRLINLVGELVITASNVKQLSEKTSNSDLVESVYTMSRLIEDIRDTSMSVRMVQIGETLRRFERVVRDLSRENGKEIDLEINGGDTELDKTLIEKISDPILHLVRNSVDHGIDMPSDREAAGKPRRGRIVVNAYHETGTIVIEVSDDGRGLSRERIFSKAVERGLLSAGQNISDSELFKLIFEPGFSTAEKVTSVSGRGVGMDVVRKNIESLRGIIDIESELGLGTTVRIHLPLTLAIIDGFMVQVGGSYYVLPLEMVTECTEVSGDEIDRNEGGNFFNLRGELLPFMRLREFFMDDSAASKRENIIVLEYARKKAGLVVDRLIGEFQTVIKPLGKLFANIKWISGATILGTGDVALILDVPMLIQHLKSSEENQEKQ